MKKLKNALLALPLLCGSAEAVEYRAQIYVHTAKETHTYNAASNCDELTYADGTYNFLCQTQQWVGISSAKDAPPKPPFVTVRMYADNYVTGERQLLTEYTRCELAVQSPIYSFKCMKVN